jgi:hypothetical protein
MTANTSPKLKLLLVLEQSYARNLEQPQVYTIAQIYQIN